MARTGHPSQNVRQQGGLGLPEEPPPAVQTPDAEVRKITVSNMSYSEMVGFYNQQLSRVDMAWFRIMYLHAAIVGVLVFFGEADDFLVFQRLVVFAFFSVNLVIFHVALKEGYEGLVEAQKDLKRFPENDGNVDRWFRSQTALYKTGVRSAILATSWAIIGFLLFRSLVLG